MHNVSAHTFSVVKIEKKNHQMPSISLVLTIEMAMLTIAGVSWFEPYSCKVGPTGWAVGIVHVFMNDKECSKLETPQPRPSSLVANRPLQCHSGRRRIFI